MPQQSLGLIPIHLIATGERSGLPLLAYLIGLKTDVSGYSLINSRIQ